MTSAFFQFSPLFTNWMTASSKQRAKLEECIGRSDLVYILVSTSLSSKQLIQTIVFWTSSVHIYQSLQFQIKIYVICWLWFQLENKQKWQEFLIFTCKWFSFLFLCDYADTLSLFFMISETLSKSFQWNAGKKSMVG